LDLLVIIPNAQRGRQGRVKLVKYADGGRIHEIVDSTDCLCLLKPAGLFPS
jgi:hypothetical protein